MSTLRIAVVTASTRPTRVGPNVTEWVMQHLRDRDDASYDVLDLEEVGLPFLDEPEPASSGHYTHEHTRRWSETIEGYDGFLFVTPEYNRGMPAPLKNALDFLYAEWNNKAAGLVVYGSSGGLRCAEQLKSVLGELQVTTVRAQVSLSIYDDMEDFSQMKPRDYQSGNLSTTVDQLVRWAKAMRGIRR
ncbi:NADPH-dependent FMN reductase [Luteipulveratus mongoliensis]|uniref:NADPH-dependent FMN reductase n=1 Tax=Luteipulveratus mongoliensis TaxID=571913 RepID=A0A0K1JEN7_9MICO|nr:NAD(P)H-dependent oxidoreductase [Luteipulveratus mongoliensis]AKU15166.1 NADPH-dependent FMN reductase [Luteipulveratus mongoliensis]